MLTYQVLPPYYSTPFSQSTPSKLPYPDESSLGGDLLHAHGHVPLRDAVNVEVDQRRHPTEMLQTVPAMRVMSIPVLRAPRVGYPVTYS